MQFGCNIVVCYLCSVSRPWTSRAGSTC